MGHPDFRVRRRIFATLGYPEHGWAMVKLPPEQQQRFVLAEPAVFAPVLGAWGRSGCTNVLLKAAATPQVQLALEAAWKNIG